MRRLAGGAAVVAVAALVVLPRLGARDLWAPDEPRYAQVAVEMVRDGHWWMPHVNGVPYAHKPHLYFWLAGLASLPQGRVTELTARLPSALALVALAWLTWDLGRRLFGAAAGTCAALAVATSWLPTWMARRASLDVLLAALTTASLWCVVRGGLASRASGSRRRTAAWGALAGAFAALGVMTKGPVALLPIACGALALALHPGLRRDRPRGHALAGAAAFVAAFALALAAWLVPAAALGGYDPLAVAREHVIDRASEGRDHARPPWYYVLNAPQQFLPWTLLAIPAFAAAFSARRRAEPRVVLLLAWGLAPLLVLSLIVEKREIYVLPLVPAWALLIGAEVEARGRDGAWPGWQRACIASAVLLGLLGLAGAAAIALGVRRRAGPLDLAWRAALGYGAALLAIHALVLPQLEPLKSGRAVGEVLAAMPEGTPIGMLPRIWDVYPFYSGRRMVALEDAAAVTAWLASQPRPAIVLLHDSDAGRLPLDGGRPPRDVFADDVGSRRILVVRYGEESP